MKRHWTGVLTLACLGAAACGKSAPAPATTPLGGFLLRFGPAGFSVARAADGAELLASYTGSAGTGTPYAPLAQRDTTATWQELFGQFKVTEGTEPWAQAPRMEADAQDPLHAFFLDDAGAQVAELRASSPEPGALLLAVTGIAQGPLPGPDRLSLAFACAADDRFLGFGEQADALDHHGHKIPIWTSEPGIGKTTSDDPPDLFFLVGARHASSVGLPTWLSQRGYVGAVEGQRRMLFELCSARPDAWRAEVWDTAMRLWIYDGPTPAQALERATRGVLGRQARPPPVAFSPWNDAIFGSANARRIAALLRGRKIPSSVIWSEDYRGGAKVNDSDYQITDEFEVDRSLYPDAEQLAQDLHAQGLLWLAYFNTFVVKGTRAFPEATAAGALAQGPNGGTQLFQGSTFLDTALVDLSPSAAGRAWYQGKLRAALAVGFDGWMSDFGEWLPHDARLASGDDGLAFHNRYAAEESRASFEVLGEAGATRPRVFFSRSGWLGSQAFTHVHWPGDQRTDFERDDGLFTVLPMALNLGLAGWSTVGSDIGGYQSATNPPTSKELYLRWLPLGALSPVMRTHHGRSAYVNWRFDSDEETLQQYARWARFHQRLFPYLDGGAAAHEQTGMPLVRALPLQFPADAAGWSLADQWLLGPSLLVAPVVDAGLASRSVHLPEGRWLAIAPPADETAAAAAPGALAAAVDGPADVTAPALLGDLPLFARGGAVVPLFPAGIQTLVPTPGLAGPAEAELSRTLLVFTGGEGDFTERDGTLYRLTRAAAAGQVGAGTTFKEAGQALGPCATPAQRGCVDPAALAGGAVRVRLGGQGPLEFAGYTLAITPSATARALDAEVR